MISKKVIPLILEFLFRQFVYLLFVCRITSYLILSKQLVLLSCNLVVLFELFFVFVQTLHVSGVLYEFCFP